MGTNTMDYWVITIDLPDDTRLTIGPFFGVESAQSHADEWAKEYGCWTGISVTRLLFDSEAKEEMDRQEGMGVRVGGDDGVELLPLDHPAWQGRRGQ